MDETADGAQILSAWIVRAGCVFSVLVILVAGLWPFHIPRNEVSWSKTDTGLEFGRHGSVWSPGSFVSHGRKQPFGCTLEIWVQPAADDDNTIVSFDSSVDSKDPDMTFSLRQERGDLTVQRYQADAKSRLARLRLTVRRALRIGKPVFITITGGDEGTNVYLDGTLAVRSAVEGFSSSDLTGRLILADASTHDSWKGNVMGLALYDRQLSTEQVKESYRTWAESRSSVIVTESLTARYQFSEGHGIVVHNQVDPATDLTMPAKYSVLHPVWLAPAWRRFRFGWPPATYWEDVLLNIAGLAPFGFALCGYFSAVRPRTSPVTTTIVISLFLSFTIETIQRFLPTRASDMTDVITNTLGAAAGAFLFRLPSIQTAWSNFLASIACLLGLQTTKIPGAGTGIPAEQTTLVV